MSGKTGMAGKKNSLSFSFARRRVKKEYLGEFSGTCYGGARETEIRDRERYLGVTK
jgi:hypothetical protein